MARGSPEAAAESTGEYVVVARRYRPQTFAELIGQEHVARGLSNAILLNRVGHAYLFTGARGVGKTSAARILAKALNCEQGPTPTPCNQCDICQSISAGEDVDVLEIDGASNRGIDEIRQLRQNVNIRPSRAQFKVYIIDEVHMLTREAFNALLKTLEEPPEHVKFIFCTTEPEKIPVTILSRCQRFDFAGIQIPSIVERLEQIVAAEGVEVERAALEVLARRAAGSMRDSQSLLEQLLAFAGAKITVADVHALLGSASAARLAGLVSHLADRDAAAALASLDQAVTEGVDVGQLLDQLLGYLRDCMAAAVGCGPDRLLHVSPTEAAEVTQVAARLGLETILAMIQIVEQTLARLRYSSHTRTLAEMSLVRMCKLQDLQSLPDLIAQLQSGVPPAPRPAAPPPAAATVPPATTPTPAAAKKKESDLRFDPPAVGAAANLALSSVATPGPVAAVGVSLNAETAPAIWEQALSGLSDIVAEFARGSNGLEWQPPDRLVVTFPATYNSGKVFCERPEQRARLEQALQEAAGQRVRLEFKLQNGETASSVAPARPMSKQQRLIEKARQPFAEHVAAVFAAVPTRLEEPDESR